MRTIGNALLILSATSIVAAIWSPLHWQFAATAVLLFLAGAYAHGTHLAAQPPTRHDDAPTGNATGPHLHHDTTGAKHTNPRNNYGTPA